MARNTTSIVALGLSASLYLCSELYSANPLFERLRTDGLAVTAEKKATLPEPFMADDLNAAEQQKVLEKVVGSRFPVRTFTSNVGTAPDVHHIKPIGRGEGDAPRVLAVDVAFVAYGSLETVADRDFLEGLHKKSKDRKIHILSADELQKRKLTPRSTKDHQERYSHGVFIVLDRVELRAGLHSIVTRQADSLLAASRIDPHFARDPDFPNEWRKITIDEEGQRKLGSAHPYFGAGGYLKITRLHEPKGALFIEYHLVYTEPSGWFAGADPLTTKLPAIIVSEVRSFRRELSAVKK
jgi:hypothetical protein